ncbi:hypothetical protein OG265_13425 [Streptomyces sp. NBC_01208]|uniref:XRE family transcriptional regulator n=1 Tax=Streptomyces glycanivorans TaxID=3033808 RepID=A0ABY9JEL3_9ACTN|nr:MULTISPECIES: hypothetical protein [unclassified Streptomyces]WLQ66216.1 hypothetical protein P8A20_22720 [Streptomyces sp. Alt3]WSR06942.1 hypothetical protein OG265_13425 [Streptomyces sp. NBC_01208]
MAAAGCVSEDYWKGCDLDRIAFADSFRQLLRSSPYSMQGARARFLGIPVSSLSCYWSGRRVPGQQRLQEMHRALAVVAKPQSVAVTLSELERLRRSAARRSRDERAALSVSTTASAPRSNGKTPVSAGSCMTRPALSAQDRRNAPGSVASQTIDALIAAGAAGERRTLLGIAWSASKAMAPSEISATVAELHDMGREDLAETVILGGRERVQDESMRLALALIERELTAYAELVMRAALPSVGDAGQGHSGYQ